MPGLVDLHGDAVARDAAGSDERVRDACSIPDDSRVVDVAIVLAWQHKAGLSGFFGKVVLEERVQVGVHAAAVRCNAARGQDEEIIREPPPVRTPAPSRWCDTPRVE